MTVFSCSPRLLVALSLAFGLPVVAADGGIAEKAPPAAVEVGGVSTLVAMEIPAGPELDTGDTNLAHALERSRKTKRPLFIYAGADWCPHAARVRHIYLGRNAAVRRELANFVVVKLVGEAAERFTAYFGTGFPTMITYDWEGRETLWRVTGAPEVGAFVEGLQAARRINDSGTRGSVPVLLGAASAAGSVAPSVEGSNFGAGEENTERTSLQLQADGLVALSSEENRFVLRPDDYGLREFAVGGRVFRFLEGALTRTVEKVVSDDGVTVEIGYRYVDQGNPHSEKKIRLIWTRAARPDELAETGFAAPERAPDFTAERYGFEYDDNLNLVLAESQVGSEQHRISLTYDDRKRIKEMRLPVTNRRIQFEYGANDKPHKISGFEGKKSTGVIISNYGPDGEITNVDSTNGGRKVALLVTSSFQELLDLIRPAGSLRNRYHGYY